MGFQLTKGKFRSYNDLCDVTWYYYQPKGVTVRAVLVFCHGMSEHIMRYDEAARYLCDEGVAVYGCDHLGHGDSVDESAPEYGYFGKKEKTLDILVENQRLLIELIRKKYPHLPLVMFGHSMGSFTVRKYMVTYPASIDGVVLCGTGGAQKGIGFAVSLLSVLSLFGGKKRKSKFADKLMFGSYNSRYPDEGEYGWLTKDASYRELYGSDPKSGFIFSLGAMQCMLRTLKEVNSPEWYQKVPLGLPVLLMSGMDDPVGGCGEGIKEIYEGLEDAEVCMLEMKLYEKDRHNILHETDRETVFADLLDFVTRVAEGVYAARSMDGCNGGWQ